MAAVSCGSNVWAFDPKPKAKRTKHTLIRLLIRNWTPQKKQPFVSVEAATHPRAPSYQQVMD